MRGTVLCFSGDGGGNIRWRFHRTQARGNKRLGADIPPLVSRTPLAHSRPVQDSNTPAPQKSSRTNWSVRVPVAHPALSTQPSQFPIGCRKLFSSWLVPRWEKRHRFVTMPNRLIPKGASLVPTTSDRLSDSWFVRNAGVSRCGK